MGTNPIADKPAIKKRKSDQTRNVVRAVHNLAMLMIVVALGLQGLTGTLDMSPWLLPDDTHIVVKYGAAALLAVGFLSIVSYFFDFWFDSYRFLRASMAHVFAPMPKMTLIYLAAISALAEEVLFRWTLQPSFGIIITSLAFTALHTMFTNPVSGRGLWAILCSLMLCWLYEQSRCLWLPVTTHVLLNISNCFTLRRVWKLVYSFDSEKIGQSITDDKGH